MHPVPFVHEQKKVEKWKSLSQVTQIEDEWVRVAYYKTHEKQKNEAIIGNMLRQYEVQMSRSEQSFLKRLDAPHP